MSGFSIIVKPEGRDLSALRAAVARQTLSGGVEFVAAGESLEKAVAASKGSLLVFLAPDALPAHDGWLAALLKPLRERLDAAVVFGRQSAAPGSPAAAVAEYERVFGPEPRAVDMDFPGEGNMACRREALGKRTFAGGTVLYAPEAQVTRAVSGTGKTAG